MDQETRKKWLSKEKWKVREAVYLILDIDPESELVKQFETTDDIPFFDEYGEEVSELAIFLECLPNDLRIKLKMFREVLTCLDMEINKQTESLKQSETRPSVYLLYGYKARNPFRGLRAIDVSFEIEAYRQFAKEKVFPIGDYGADVPIFGLFYEDQNSQNETGSTIPSVQNVGKSNIEVAEPEVNQLDNKPSNVALAPDQLEIVDGITVQDIRDFIDKNSKEYCPRFLVALLFLKKAKGITRGKSLYNNLLNNEIQIICEKLGVGNLDSEGNFNVPNIEKRTIERLASHDTKTKGGRPSNS